ncbi:hypothetical protein [Apilactobacillus kunkeei]|uniref:hypothetical protein n=1 Tax=Apilactobacillus kunkeei TaxID=148814 RepID=UPI001C89A4F8|nr:hypothetical protein [Apilactobacillus kunkeei]MBX8456238.1 hypothetical protein [Apilactobacillus kunkeei]
MMAESADEIQDAKEKGLKYISTLYENFSNFNEQELTPKKNKIQTIIHNNSTHIQVAITKLPNLSETEKKQILTEIKTEEEERIKQLSSMQLIETIENTAKESKIIMSNILKKAAILNATHA